MKTCTSCKFVKYSAWYSRWACTRKHLPDLVVLDPVDGNSKSIPQTPAEDRMLDCTTERSRRFFGCGPKAKFHQPK